MRLAGMYSLAYIKIVQVRSWLACPVFISGGPSLREGFEFARFHDFLAEE
jgi:hypothetical protein